MDGVNKGSFCGGIPGKEQGLSLKDYYLIKSQVMRRYRSNKLMEEYDENLLGGLRHDIDEMRQVLLETTVDEVGRCVFSGVRGISLGR